VADAHTDPDTHTRALPDSARHHAEPEPKCVAVSHAFALRNSRCIRVGADFAKNSQENPSTYAWECESVLP